MIKPIAFLKAVLLILIPMLFFMHALFQLTPKTSVATNIKTVINNESQLAEEVGK